MVKIEKKKKSGKNDITKEFQVILKVIESNGKTTKSAKVKSRGNSINLHLLMIKLLNAKNRRSSKNIMDLMKHLIF